MSDDYGDYPENREDYSVHRSLNPRQFGFLAFSPRRDREIETKLGGIGHMTNPTRRRIRLDRPMRAGQADMYQEPYEHYLKNPRKTFKGFEQPTPEVLRYKNENIVWTGHHRIAAARKRGQKTMSVNYQEVD
jgi:hypothetical protein